MNKNTILIVDDVEMNRVILGNMFKKKYEILEASDGEEALECIRKNGDKLVAMLLDLVMPNIDGIEVLRTMQAENLVKELPIFIITTDNSDEVMYEAYELGVKDVIEKPFVPHFLKKRIENVIELYKIKNYQEKVMNKKIENINGQNQNLIEILTLALDFKNNLPDESIKNIKRLTLGLLQGLKGEGEESCINLTDREIEIISEGILPNIGIWIEIIGMLGIYEKLIYDNKSEVFSKKDAIEILRSGKYGAFNPKLLKILETLE